MNAKTLDSMAGIIEFAKSNPACNHLFSGWQEEFGITITTDTLEDMQRAARVRRAIRRIFILSILAAILVIGADWIMPFLGKDWLTYIVFAFFVFWVALFIVLDRYDRASIEQTISAFVRDYHNLREEIESLSSPRRLEDLTPEEIWKILDGKFVRDAKAALRYEEEFAFLDEDEQDFFMPLDESDFDDLEDLCSRFGFSVPSYGQYLERAKEECTAAA